MKRFLNSQNLLIAILIFTALSRLIRLDYPTGYVFDEVYHAFTAKEYLNGSKEAWEWWTTPPPGVAFEWTHPPLAKEIMTASMWITGSTESWAWRLPGVLFGTLSVLLVYLISFQLFKNKVISLLAAFIFSVDGLNFVQSRTGMNDAYVIAFILASLLFYLKKHFIFSAVFLGLALSSKWAALYLFGVYFILLLKDRHLRPAAYYILIPPIIYLLSYLPFFMLGHTFDQFIELQKQMWWYHTNLNATHDYASPWWSWPFNLFPVWYFVDYKNDQTANIFASGNPIVFWLGFSAIILTVWEFVLLFLKRINAVKNKHPQQTYHALFIVLLGYFAFWLPWAFSPRIMFLYHYAPCVPFLSLALAYQIYSIYLTFQNKVFVTIILGLILLGFIAFYPIFTGVPLDKETLNLFFLTNTTKNPFANY